MEVSVLCPSLSPLRGGLSPPIEKMSIWGSSIQIYVSNNYSIVVRVLKKNNRRSEREEKLSAISKACYLSLEDAGIAELFPSS